MDDVDELQRHGRSSVARSAPAPICAECWALCAETTVVAVPALYNTARTVDGTERCTLRHRAGAPQGLKRHGCATLSRKCDNRRAIEGGRTRFNVLWLKLAKYT